MGKLFKILGFIVFLVVVVTVQTAFWGWLLMLLIGALAKNDVIGGSTSYIESCGIGFLISLLISWIMKSGAKNA